MIMVYFTVFEVAQDKLPVILIQGPNEPCISATWWVWLN